jgi:hypothetical protein
MDAAELKDDDLHEKRMARLARERQEKADMIAALELADDVLRVVVKVYGPSPIVELTRGKISAVLVPQQSGVKT